MTTLPFLPGNTFTDPTTTKYHRSQTLGYRNGFSVPKNPISVGIGGVEITANQLSGAEIDELANFKPTLTYGQAKLDPPKTFVPAHVFYDKKVLRFYGYLRQAIQESSSETHRVRPVHIYYYLEDDTIAIVEPKNENSGIPQGKLIKRQRLPKDNFGNHWHWTDINIRDNFTVYGKVFHVCDCDKWTKEYLESQGIDVNPPEDMPVDPYAQTRKESEKPKVVATKSDFDKLKQFLELDRKVLRFYCVWDDRPAVFGELRPFVVQYFLVDDSVEVLEKHHANDGRDPFPVLLRRARLPKDRYDVDAGFPGLVLELTDNEIKEYYTPRDFAIGKTINILNRRFLIYDCDKFTKDFYYFNFGLTDFTPINVKGTDGEFPPREIPPYNGFGSLEDSLQSCLSIIPQPPRKDYIKMLENDGKLLRYLAELETVDGPAGDRKFIVTYRLADDMISIFEMPGRNSGQIPGKFMEKARVEKSTSTDPNNPEFLGPQDLVIGESLFINGWRFRLLDADDYVLAYLESHQENFPGIGKALDSLRNLRARPSSKDDCTCPPEDD